MSDKINVILADCEAQEIEDFHKGCSSTGTQFDVLSSISNQGHGTFLLNAKRYLAYFNFPFKVFLRRRKYARIIGWQQFYAINFAFFCRLFGVKKTTEVTVVNFVFREKGGLVGKIYSRYMKYAVCSDYIDRFVISSPSAAAELTRFFNLPESKVAVAGFGVPDNYSALENIPAPDSDYVLSLGRSNRDFDFLVDLFSQPSLQGEKLVIISDTWHPERELPPNIRHYDNIVGEPTFAWMRHCKASIISIAEPSVCSGDTVLLNCMMLARPVLITSPSTLAEMYVTDGVDGLYFGKDVSTAAKKVATLMCDAEMRETLGARARKKYLESFTRFHFGANVIRLIL